jgi:hypothetical protein
MEINTILEVAEQVLIVAGAVCVAASLVTASTNTPDPNTKLGKVYKFIEALALVVGKAKK